MNTQKIKLNPVIPFISLLLLLLTGYLIWNKKSGNTSTRAFIPGTYVNSASGPYSIAYDTLIIHAMDQKEGTYRIYRKTAFQRIREGNKLPLERESEQWMALYNQQTQSMEETKTGKLITLYPEAGRILVGSREYLKIKSP